MKRLENFGESVYIGRDNDDFFSDLQAIFESDIARLPEPSARGGCEV